MAMLSARFETRREAEHMVEMLVQQMGAERQLVAVTPEGPLNTVGTEAAGADLHLGEPLPERGDAAATEGAIRVAIHDNRVDTDQVRQAFADAGGTDIKPIQ